jgi:CheY-like chemotaxis protein
VIQQDAASGFDILIAEDNPANAMIVKLMLEQLGHTPVVVANGEEAVAAARTQPFDLVLMDIRMPVMDGYEAARRMRSEAGPIATTRIVALTAHAQDHNPQDFVRKGFDDVVAKPIVVADLADAVRRHAGKRADDAASDPAGQAP